MIRSFACAETPRFFATGKPRRIPPLVHARLALRLTQLDAAASVNDLRFPPSNHLEALKGGRKGQWSVRVDSRWRLCFRFVNGDAFDVALVDYH